MFSFALNSFHDLWGWMAGELRTLFAVSPIKSQEPFGSESLTISEQELGRIPLGNKHDELFLLPNGSIVFTGSHFKLSGIPRRLPLCRLMAIGRVHVSEKTPFAPEQIHIIPCPGVEDVKESCFYVIKKEQLDQSLADLSADAVPIIRLGIVNGKQIQWVPSRVLERLHPLFYHIRYWRNFLFVALTTLLIGLGATYAHTLFRYSIAEQNLNDLIDVKRGEALQVRKLLADYDNSIAAVDAARKGKSQAIPILRVWEELTRTLPDDAWLTDLSIDGDNLTITGFAAQSAAGLIVVLGSSPMFSAPSFTSPVVRVPGQVGERFEIRMRMQGI